MIHKELIRGTGKKDLSLDEKQGHFPMWRIHKYQVGGRDHCSLERQQMSHKTLIHETVKKDLSLDEKQ